ESHARVRLVLRMHDVLAVERDGVFVVLVDRADERQRRAPGRRKARETLLDDGEIGAAAAKDIAAHGLAVTDPAVRDDDRAAPAALLEREPGRAPAGEHADREQAARERGAVEVAIRREGRADDELLARARR